MNKEQEIVIDEVALYLQERKTRDAERWRWIAEAFEKAFEEGK